MKKNCGGFMLAETLIVTTFVAGVLIFLFVQFSILNNSYDESYVYNTVEGLYATDDIIDYIKTDSKVLEYIKTNVDSNTYVDITDCSLFINMEYCKELFSLENIDKVFISTNEISYDINAYDDKFKKFISKINKEGNESYRVVAAFKNSTYATVRFGV